MAIADSIKTARDRGATADQIVAQIEKANPAKAAVFAEARKRGANSDAILAQVERQNAAKAAEAAPARQTPMERVARILAPKSVEGLGETLGTAAAVATGEAAKQDEATLEESEARFQLARQLRTASPEQKERIKKMLGQGQETKVASEATPGINKTARQVAGEAVGTALAVATPASIVGKAPGAATVVGRVAQGAAFGGGAGLEKGLQDEAKGAGDVVASAAKGAAAGAAVAGAFEGVRALAGSLLKSRAADKFAARRINRELQPKRAEIAAAFERESKTFGEDVLAIRDKAGRPIYQGSLDDLIGTANRDIPETGKQLMRRVGTYKDPLFTRREVSSKVLERLDDEFGMLTKAEKRMVLTEALRMPGRVNGTDAVLAKRTFDNKIPDSFWQKIATGDRKTAVATYARYLYRDELRRMLNERTGDKVIQALNDRMSVGMDVRKLAAAQKAAGELAKLPFSLTNAVAKVLEKTVFNPQVTTRVAAGVQRASGAAKAGAAPGAASTAIRRSAELGAGAAAGR